MLRTGLRCTETGSFNTGLGPHLCLSTETTPMSSTTLTIAAFVESGPIPSGGSKERTTLTSWRCEIVPSVSLTCPHILISIPIWVGLNAQRSSLCTAPSLAADPMNGLEARRSRACQANIVYAVCGCLPLNHACCCLK